MWTDIDYMDRRRVFTLDPERFPLGKVRELVHHLHQHHQHYIMMVDPAISDSGMYSNWATVAGIYIMIKHVPNFLQRMRPLNEE